MTKRCSVGYMKKLCYKNTNRFNEYLTAAKTISKKISKIEGVIGILATGGLGRCYCDDYSDLDLIVHVDKYKLKKIERVLAIGNLNYKGIELDIPVISYQKVLKLKSPSKYWSQVMRWDRENSIIMFDTDNKMKKMLKEKLIFPDSEQKELLERYRSEIKIMLKYDFEMWEKEEIY